MGSKNIKVNDDGTISPIDLTKPSTFTTQPDHTNELDEILKEFLDETDYVLEAPIEQADDKDWFVRPYKQAKAQIQDYIDKLCNEARIEIYRKLLDFTKAGAIIDWDFLDGGIGELELQEQDRLKQLGGKT